MNQVPPVSPDGRRFSSIERRVRSTMSARRVRTSPVGRPWLAAGRCCGPRTSD